MYGTFRSCGLSLTKIPGKFYLVDDENRVVFSDSSEEIGGQFSMSDLSVGISSCEMEGVLYDAMVSESGHQGWKSVKMIMRSKLDKEIRSGSL